MWMVGGFPPTPRSSSCRLVSSRLVSWISGAPILPFFEFLMTSIAWVGLLKGGASLTFMVISMYLKVGSEILSRMLVFSRGSGGQRTGQVSASRKRW